MGRKATRTSTANQPCKGSRGRNPTTPNLPRRSQRVSTPFKKKETAGGVKRKNRHSQAKHRGEGSHNRHQTLPKSMSNPTWLAELTHSNKKGVQNVIASKSPFVVRSRTHPFLALAPLCGSFSFGTSHPCRTLPTDFPSPLPLP